MNETTFRDQVREARQRAAHLHQRATTAHAPSLELMMEALEELSTTLEELQVAQEELRSQNEELLLGRIAADAERHRYQDLFELAPEGYVVTSPEGVITAANRAAARLLQMPARRLVGKPLVLFLAEADRHPFHTELSRLLQGQPPREQTLRLWPRGESGPQKERVAIFGVAVQRDLDTGQVVLCWQFRDITERVQAEEEARLLQAEAQRKDDFLALVAHELRGPLAPLRVAVQALELADPREDDAIRAREVIARQVTHLARLVDDLLDAARIARGKVTLARERLDLAALVRSTVEDRRAGLEEGGLSVVLELPEEPLWVQGDPIRLAQVVGNLLHNAWKFTERGGRVTVKAEALAGRVRVTVADTGIGIAPEMLPHVFTMFAGGESSTARSVGGLGLGLAVVRGIVELHGGRVEALSEGLGRGAVFAFELPLRPDPEETRRTQSAEQPLAPRRVLVIDDSSDTADTLAILLRRWGHDVQVAYDGSSGIERATVFRPDLVLCDLGLPDMTGYEVARALRQNPATASCCLVAASGYGREVDRRESEAAGFEQHLIKPIDLERLRRLLSTTPH